MYRTGDVARFRDDGAIEFLGRSDHQVKIRGYRIELGEIETALNQQPSVREGVVVAREDTPGDQRLVAYLVPEGKEASSGDLRDALRAKLPEYMVPAHFVVLDRLPLTPNGKIDRKALPAVDREMGATRVEPITAPPLDDTEKLVAAIWSDELDVPVGRDDNFFDVGGHSLLAVKVFRRLCEETGAPLALTDVFRFPTVRTIAAHVGTLLGSPSVDEPARAVGGATGVDRGAMRRRVLAQRGRGANQGDDR
jgi:acyl carrier protein